MQFPLKTTQQLKTLISGFRRQSGLTQTALAERLGITQQAYAIFEANPERASVERLVRVLQLLDVEVSFAEADRGMAGTGGRGAPAPAPHKNRPVTPAGEQVKSWSGAIRKSPDAPTPSPASSPGATGKKRQSARVHTPSAAPRKVSLRDKEQHAPQRRSRKKAEPVAPRAKIGKREAW